MFTEQTTTSQVHFEMRFASLFRDGYGRAFPCDRDGFVDIEALSACARSSFLSTVDRIGRDFAHPFVLARG